MGRGEVFEKPCRKCKLGMIKGIKHISFDLPPGIDDGDYLVRGEGESVPDGQNGDLVVRVRVSPHPKFKRDGSDLFYDLDISMFDAALGNEVDVPTLEKSEKIKIEQGSQPNTILKLKGKGLPRLNSRGKGDQFVRLIVNIPKKLSKEEKNILKQFQDKTD